MNEKQIQNDILSKFGTRSDMRLWRANAGVAKYKDRVVKFGVAGQADLTGILPDGRRLEIEVKGPKGKQSKEQIAYQAMITRFGGLYILAYAVQDVTDALERHGYDV